MTNTIGRGNALVPLCMPGEVKTLLGREAFEENRSLGNLILNAALEHFRTVKPALAAQIDAARQEHLRLKSAAVCLVVGLFAIGIATFNDDETLRCARGIRARKTANRIEYV